jgi:hypothetical protein
VVVGSGTFLMELESQALDPLSCEAVTNLLISGLSGSEEHQHH